MNRCQLLGYSNDLEGHSKPGSFESDQDVESAVLSFCLFKRCEDAVWGLLFCESGIWICIQHLCSPRVSEPNKETRWYEKSQHTGYTSAI